MDFNIDDFIETVTSNKRFFIGALSKKVKYFELLDELLKKFKNELLQSDENYKVITDTSGLLKWVRFDSGRIVPNELLFDRIEKLEL